MRILTVGTLTLIVLASALFGAQPSQRDAAAEAQLEKELAAINPALVEPFHKGTAAMDKEAYAESAAFFETVCQQAPTFDAALRRLGWSLANTGRTVEGLAWAEKAVAAKRSAANLGTIADILAFPRKGTPSDADRRRALTVLKEAAALPDGQDASTLLRTTQVAFQLQDWDTARHQIDVLQRKYDDLMPTHYFAAYLAAVEQHWVRAENEIKRARKLGLDEESTQKFLDSGIHTRAIAWRLIGSTTWVLAVWAIGLTALCALGFALSKATLRQIERSEVNVPVTPAEHRLRRIYRSVLNLAGVYYYVSLPIVLVLVIGAAAAMIYGFFAIGWVPIKLVLILGIGAIATIWSMGRSLFLRVKSEDPGRGLTREEAPALWELTDEVAATLNTRAIDEIRITPGTDVCVYERGSWREKMENRAKRILVLGAAVLNDFKQEDFRSVLAHEYGHFSNRDTAGGDVALRVRNDMLKFYFTMLHAGQATWLNIAFHFLRLYNFIFRRISHGATRLQEVLADRVAAQTYGPAAFEGGLRHVIRRSLEFGVHADQEIKAAIDARRPIQNLYEAPATTLANLEEEYAKAINRPTTEDDTHPAPHDRFRLIARISAPPRAPSTGTVWDLFADRAAVQREMMETVEKNIATHRK